MRLRRRSLLCATVSISALALLVFAAGCRNEDARASAGGQGLVIKDPTGRKHRLAAHPQRIATTASFVVELLTELGRPPILRPDVPAEEVAPAARAIDTWAVDHSVGPNLEQLVAANPDLVILSPMFARYVPTIEERLGVPVVVLSVRRLEDLGPTATWLGELVGDKEAGCSLAQCIEAQVSAIQPPSHEGTPRVYAIFGTPTDSLAFLPDSYLGSLVAHLDGELITAGATPAMISQQFTPLSREFVVNENPDVILIVHHGPPNQRFEDSMRHPAWSRLHAVRDGRVHVLSHRRYVTNPGPSAVAALQELRTLLYPGQAGT